MATVEMPGMQPKLLNAVMPVFVPVGFNTWIPDAGFFWLLGKIEYAFNAAFTTDQAFQSW